MNKSELRKYVELILKIGINFQKGEGIFISYRVGDGSKYFQYT